MREITISKQRLSDIIEQTCEYACHWDVDCESQEQLDRICEECPLNNIDNEEYWERREDNGN